MHPILGRHGAVVAPHSLAAQAGLDILREGGNAIEASIAVAATLAVVYPHMTGIGGDAFWLIRTPGKPVTSIDACGASGQNVVSSLYAGSGTIPWRGPLAAITVAGTASGWASAFALSQREWGGRLPFSRLMEAAVEYARRGYPVSASQARYTRLKKGELSGQPGFLRSFMPQGRIPEYGEILCLPQLADSLEQIGRAGPDDFYRGDLAAVIAADLADVGSPLNLRDLADHQAVQKPALSLRLANVTLYNMAPPTQGISSLLILGLFERIREAHWTPDTAEGIHLIVEATKQAFLVRDKSIGDPTCMHHTPEELLGECNLDRMLGNIALDGASAWPAPVSDGDTTWMGASDSAGRTVSLIQSIYFEFGSGVVLPHSGICWQNRGCAFELPPGRLRSLAPGRKPFHTLNPAMAEFNDGRVMSYGTMGGEGQPQTQAAIFSRYAWGGHNIRSAIAAPRWLLGRTWAEQSTSLKLEARYPAAVLDQLRTLGHPVEVVDAFDDRMGHAGALVIHPGGWIEGGEDPRSDGCVAAW